MSGKVGFVGLGIREDRWPPPSGAGTISWSTTERGKGEER